jgi:ABC-2 type transport system ATP-binding protein
LTIHITENNQLLTKLIDLLRTKEIEILNIGVVKPTLDDVFIHYTGRGLSEMYLESSG